MYYVYYIPGVKVGCTNNLEERVEKQQGYTKDQYKVLFSTKSIELASKKEKFFQDTLGYKVDDDTYLELISKTNPMKIKVYANSVTFGDPSTVLTKETLMSAGVITDSTKEFLDYDIVISEDVAKFILKNIKPSQYPAKFGKFVYLSKLKNKFSIEVVEDDENSMFDKIRKWANDKGILESGTAQVQTIKVLEEGGELAQAVLKNNRPEIKDAIGDLVVVLTSLAHLSGFTIEECIKEAYDVISKRTGKMINGDFIKD